MAYKISSPDIIHTQDSEQVEGEVFTENPVAGLARHLAEQYALSQEMVGKPLPLHRLQQQEQLLNRAYQHFSSTAQQDIASSYAAEWLLDNFFVVQQTIRQIREDMPSGYYQQLPKLKNTMWAKYPRIYALGQETIAYSNSQINIEDTVTLLQAFQVDGRCVFDDGRTLGISYNVASGYSGQPDESAGSPCPDRNAVCVPDPIHCRRQPGWILHHQLTNVSHPGLGKLF
jgi:hypothetical protein